MTVHRFLQEPKVTEADLEEILDLSAVGQLAWERSRLFTIFRSSVFSSLGEDAVQSCNLRSIEVRKEGGEFTELGLTDVGGETYQLGPDSEQPTLWLAKRVLYAAEFGTRSKRGRLSGKIQECVPCERETGHIGLYDVPYGLAGAVLVGTERIECLCCGNTEPLRSS